MPDVPGLRRLSLAELDDAALRTLIDHGEDLFVERKRALPTPPKFGAAAGSFANSLGGWILLGVSDDGDVFGWQPPEGADLQSHLGAVLRQEIDPLPPFVSGMREVDGRQIAVVRVFESMDSPHVVRGTGAVYVRSAAGKEPIDDHRTLLELARRGEEAEDRARKRLAELPAIRNLLRPPDAGMDDMSTTEVRFIVRAAPLTVTPTLTEWPLTRAASEWCQTFADGFLPSHSPPYTRYGPTSEPYGRAVAARVRQDQGSGQQHAVLTVADSGGVVGIEIRRGAAQGDAPALMISTTLDGELRPALVGLVDALTRAEAFGRAVADVWIIQAIGGQLHGGMRTAPRLLHAAGELSIPAEPSEVEALASSWQRELEREVGLERFEGE